MATTTFINKVEQALEELVTLNIVTAVGEAQVVTTPAGPGEANDRRKVVLAASNKVIWTSIDLLQGDITTAIHPEFQGDAGKDLREFHKARETQGMAIIKQNVDTLRDLVKLLGDAYESHKARPKDLPVAPAKSGA